MNRRSFLKFLSALIPGAAIYKLPAVAAKLPEDELFEVMQQEINLEINLEINQEVVKSLKAVWSPEAAADLLTMYNLSTEAQINSFPSL